MASALTSGLESAVADAMRAVARDVVLTGVGRLRAGEVQVEDKGAGSVVTEADREAERRLAIALTGLLPGSRVVGEEAVHAAPGLLEGVGEGDVWLVDPIDGTGNYVRGREPFVMRLSGFGCGIDVLSTSPNEGVFPFCSAGTSLSRCRA